jgi:predicted MPP superfamily phosphohydrolase
MNKIGFLIVFSIYASINVYLFTRGWQALPKSGIIQPIYIAVFLICALSFFVVLAFGEKMAPTFSAIFENIGGFWMIALLYFLVAALFFDLIRLTDHLFGIYPEIIKANYPIVKIIALGSVLLFLLVISVVGYARFANPQVVKLNLDIPKNGNHIDSLSIVAASDVHLGDMIRKGRLVKYVELINSQNPDIIVIAGDLFDRNLHTVEEQGMDTVLQKLKAKYGVYAVVGNHEYFGNVARAANYMVKSGIKVLRDDAVTIDNKFILIGRDDYTNKHRKPLKTIISGSDKNLPMILLDHQPINLAEAVENKMDVQISGHTHNGQIYPFSLIVAKMYQLAYGYLKIGKTHFYVSSGLGLWGAPIRLGTQSEIVNINLKFGSK